MVTDTLRTPAVASPAMVMFAVICVRLLTVMLLTAMPVPKLAIVDPANLVPVIITDRLCPCRPLAGLTVVMVGGSGVFRNMEILRLLI